MSNILVFLQCENKKISSASCAAITAARQLQVAWGKKDLVGIVVGSSAEEDAKVAATFGFAKVLQVVLPSSVAHYALAYAQVVGDAARHIEADTVVAAASSFGKEMLPGVAALLDAAMGSDITAVQSDGNLVRPTYAGNAIAEIQLTTRVRCVSVRGTSFVAAEPAGETSAIETFSIAVDALPKSELVSFQSSATGRPELGDARIVVSGGRGVQSKEGFEKYIFPLADKLGAAIGASRAAVDAGFAPNDWQVGQTGKTVAPQLYIAVGISGAIQHLAGIKDAKVVVAINKDADAPIFEIADYGLVANIESAIPELIEKLP